MDTERAEELLLAERREIAELHQRVTETGDLDESLEASTGELTGLDQHLGDHATELFEREKDRSIGASLEDKLAEIDAALERIDNGDYGLCQVCGDEVDDERLSALPATRFCREHAGTREPRGGPELEITQELDGI